MLVMFKCPKTKKLISTGIEIDPMKIDSLPDRLTFSHCPFCGSSHGWAPKDTFLVEGRSTKLNQRVL
jgi:hypothetical protein